MAKPTIPVWLDCDPGHDDATAILLAGHTPGLRLLGISTIGGNQTLAKVTQNALDVLDAVGLSHIDVVPGSPRPMMRPVMLCPEIHGDSGLDGPGGGRLLPRSRRKPLAGRAVNVMFDAISAAYEDLKTAAVEAEAPITVDSASNAPGFDGSTPRVRLICTGALTNAALLLLVYPEVAAMIEISLMGGAIGIGNMGPVMEFNIQTDPDAAKIVFESGVPLTMVPLEVTHTVLATPAVLAAIGSGSDLPHAPSALSTVTTATPNGPGPGIASLANGAAAAVATVAAVAAATGGGAGGGHSNGCGVVTNGNGAASVTVSGDGNGCGVAAPVIPVAASPFRFTIQQLLLYFAETYKREFHFEHPPLHDPVAVAYVVHPELFEVKPMRVDVETSSPLSYGQTVCDVWRQSRKPPNVGVALRVDVEAFWLLLLAAVARADAVSPLNGPGGRKVVADGIAVKMGGENGDTNGA